MTVEIIKYEIRELGTDKWTECSRQTYVELKQSSQPVPFEVRALGLIKDEGDLIIPGPKGFATWKDAALDEKLCRIEVQKENSEMFNLLIDMDDALSDHPDDTKILPDSFVRSWKQRVRIVRQRDMDNGIKQAEEMNENMRLFGTIDNPSK